MNVLNNSNDDTVECPLCMEPLEVDDLNFYPCTCGYQICRFCWHRIRTDENELCPACRKAYPENPADFTPLSQEQISALKAEKRQRDQQRKQKITENRKHLANVRVVQKNLVFVVGLPPRLADPEILKRHEYFGKYGKIHKVVINPSTTYAGVQGPSASAYVTYLQNNDSLRAIQAVNNIMIDGRLIKTSLGTTKYCSHFMKNQQCPKPDCMYLHELGDPEASFTKEEMHQGKHQEYEKRLHDALIALTQQQSSSTTPPPPTINGSTESLGIGVAVVGSPTTNKIIETIHSKISPSSNGTSNGPIQSKEAWPSLSTSPVNKENKINNKTNNSNNGSGGGGKENTIKNSENRKHEKTKNKDTKGNKNNKQNNNSNHNSNSNSNKEQNIRQENILTEKNNKQNNNNSLIINNITDDDSNSLPEFENDDLSNDGKADTPSLSSSTSSSNNGDSGTVSESASGKSSPGTFHDNTNVIKSSLSTSSASSTSSTSSSSHLQQVEQHNKTNLEKSAQFGTSDTSNTLFSGTTDIKNNSNIIDTSSRFSKLSLFDDNNSFFSTNTFQPYFKNEGTVNSNPSHLPDLLNGTAESDETCLEREQRDAKLLLKGLSGFHHLNNENSSEDWEAAFKYVMMRNSNNKQLEEQQHDEMLRVQELHKQRNLVNSLNGIPSQPHLQINNFNGIDYTNSTDYLHNLPDLNRLSQLQQQQRLHNSIHAVQENGHIFPGNMSKFFDFHKNQQNIHNGHSNSPQQQISDQLNMANLLENSRLNSHYFDQSQANSMIGQQQQQLQQKQRILPNKYDQIGSHNLLMNNNTTNQQQKRLQQQPPAQHPHYMPIDDDLGFDPFIETQKALAELMENENIQQQTQINHNKLLDQSRPRMPPPGFNHMNAFGFGVPRAGSKILPFMNMNANTPPQPPQQQQPQQNNWSQHMNYQQQQQQQNQSNDPHNHQSQNNQHKGFGSMSDWTTLDPAIVSYRQFPSFMSGPPMQQSQQQHNAADMFMPQLKQQNQGFGGHHGINLQNSIINQQQQNSPAQVNYSHTNWLNTNLDQNNMYMNNLTNGFTNNFDKYSIPMPPGFQNNVGSKPQQKTECIN